MGASIDFLSLIQVITPSFLLLLFIYIYNQPRQDGKKKNKKYHPLVGTVFNLLINFDRLHHYMTDLAVKYKTYRLKSLFHDEIYTADPANVEYILKTNFKNYGKGLYAHDILEDLFGEGIFTVDGDKWREQRKISSHEFSTKVLRDFSSIIFMKNTIKLKKILSKVANSNQIIDIHDLFMRTTMDSIFKVGFGLDLDNLGGSIEGVRFSHAFNEANRLTARRFSDISWKIKKSLNIGSEAKLKKNIKVLDEFVYKLIQRKIEQMHKPNEDISLKKEDILSRFLEMSNGDPKYCRDIILSFVIAGKEAIASTMSWFLYMLCKHPKVQDEVAKEITDAMENFEGHVSEEGLNKMQYLQAALSEAIRLYPNVPMDPKICFSDDVLPDGCRVKKGDVVAFLPYAMGRMKLIWGEDALEFKPERWIDDNGCFRPESPFKFSAFQGGPRACLGRDFAYRQMKILSCVLLGCFTFKLSDEKAVARYKTMINLQMDGPLHICVFNRSTST